jgi:crossover junction endodeoxyribonuclease RuvC
VFVLGIDPGLSRCGYGAVVGSARGPEARAIGVIRTSPADDLPIRLTELQRELRALIAELEPDVVAVERIFFQNNVRTAMSVGQASGLAMAEAVAAGCEVVQYSPNEVKLAVAGDGAADKTQVQAMVQRLLRLAAPPRPADAADAAALALCHLAHAPARARLAAAGGRTRS